MQHFNASDGVKLAYTIDDFTDPWLKPPTLLLLHAAMGHSQRYYAWVPRLCASLSRRAHGSARAWLFRKYRRPSPRSRWSGW